ncbi:hypothetical protein CGLAUT_07505 [Corynebacterium glaucum]|uniref:DUF6114 domain-containing protein n=1 Tax=Corynebacterium glaucum TaxID=187491 RepID=UPI0025B4D5FA|nr:DUF6114 domain-containing protein [Corynebacterium glaucum]WJZ07982.1 hypothetical protein CGLAUT_07505 [Corynebacterium glaucum]
MPAKSVKDERDDFDDYIEDDLARNDEIDTVPPGPTQVAENAKSAGGSGTSRTGFAAWRNSRPFWPGLLVIISGIIMLAPAYFTIRISDLLVMISTISGVSTLLIGALLIMFGLGMWLQPAAVVYLGVLSILVALIALPASNIGGFIIGTLTGIIGGSLALAWESGDRKPRRKRRSHRGMNATDGAAAEAADAPATQGDSARAIPPTGGSTRVITGSTAQSIIAVIGCVTVVGLSLAESRTVYAQEPAPAPAALPVGLPQVPTPSDILVDLESRIPAPPQLPQPPALPSPGEPPHIPIPDSVTVPGLGEIVSPATDEVPPPGKPSPSGNVSVVTADSVVLTGSVHVTLEELPVGGTIQRVLVLSGDKLVAKNLGLTIPGLLDDGFLATGPIDTTVANGPVRVIATGLTATPAVANASTVPVAVDLNGTVVSVLDQLGIPTPNDVPQVNVPNAVMDQISLRNVTLQMVSLYGMNFNAPGVELSASR